MLTQTCFSHLGTSLQTRVPVFIKVRDVNDNAPEFAMYYETFVCENVKAGQVRDQYISFPLLRQIYIFKFPLYVLVKFVIYSQLLHIRGNDMKNLNRQLTMHNDKIIHFV